MNSSPVGLNEEIAIYRKFDCIDLEAGLPVGRQAEGGRLIKNLCREYGISETPL